MLEIIRVKGGTVEKCALSALKEVRPTRYTILKGLRPPAQG